MKAAAVATLAHDDRFRCLFRHVQPGPPSAIMTTTVAQMHEDMYAAATRPFSSEARGILVIDTC